MASMALAKAGRLKPEIRLAQAVSEFEADLAGDQKATFRADRAQSCKTPPSIQDVMRFTAEMDLQMSRKLGGGRCVGPRMTNLVQAVQQFAALGDVVIGGTQNLLACGVWTLVRMTLLVSLYSVLPDLCRHIWRCHPRWVCTDRLASVSSGKVSLS